MQLEKGMNLMRASMSMAKHPSGLGDHAADDDHDDDGSGVPRWTIMPDDGR